MINKISAFRKSKIYTITGDRDGKLWITHKPYHGCLTTEELTLNASSVEYLYEKNIVWVGGNIKYGIIYKHNPTFLSIIIYKIKRFFWRKKYQFKYFIDVKIKKIYIIADPSLD